MLKLGCVPYMNALPLTYSLNPKEVELIHRPPTQLLDLLKNNQVEAALLPIVNYFENPDLHLIPGLAIACRGPVKSVNFYLNDPKKNLQELKTIFLDPESRTSHALLKVLLRDKFKIDLSTLHFTSDAQHPDLDAKLLIGDKTFLENGPALDLGEEWCSWQQKPFVFAAWMTLQPKNKLTDLLLESRNRGLQNIDKIIDQLIHPPSPQSSPLRHRMDQPLAEKRERVLEEALLKDYFTKNIHYTMEALELDGIRRFYELLKPIQGYSHELNFKFVS